MAYSPQNFTITNKSLGVAQAVPTDARSWFYDATLFKMRPYTSIAEVLAHLNTETKRKGHFSVFVNSTGVLDNGDIIGGQVEEYWFRNGTASNNLVKKFDTANEKVFTNGIKDTNGNVTLGDLTATVTVLGNNNDYDILDLNSMSISTKSSESLEKSSLDINKSNTWLYTENNLKRGEVNTYTDRVDIQHYDKSDSTFVSKVSVAESGITLDNEAGNLYIKRLSENATAYTLAYNPTTGKVSYGSYGGINIYNTNGTLSGDRTIYGADKKFLLENTSEIHLASNDLGYSQYAYLNLNRGYSEMISETINGMAFMHLSGTATGQIQFEANAGTQSTHFNIGSDKVTLKLASFEDDNAQLFIESLPSAVQTEVLGINPVTGEVTRMTAASGGDNIYTADGIVSSARTVDVQGQSITFTGVDPYGNGEGILKIASNYIDFTYFDDYGNNINSEYMPGQYYIQNQYAPDNTGGNISNWTNTPGWSTLRSGQWITDTVSNTTTHYGNVRLELKIDDKKAWMGYDEFYSSNDKFYIEAADQYVQFRIDTALGEKIFKMNPDGSLMATSLVGGGNIVALADGTLAIGAGGGSDTNIANTDLIIAQERIITINDTVGITWLFNGETENHYTESYEEDNRYEKSYYSPDSYILITHTNTFGNNAVRTATGNLEDTLFSVEYQSGENWEISSYNQEGMNIWSHIKVNSFDIEIAPNRDLLLPTLTELVTGDQKTLVWDNTTKKVGFSNASAGANIGNSDLTLSGPRILSLNENPLTFIVSNAEGASYEGSYLTIDYKSSIEASWYESYDAFLKMYDVEFYYTTDNRFGEYTASRLTAEFVTFWSQYTPPEGSPNRGGVSYFQAHAANGETILNFSSDNYHSGVKARHDDVLIGRINDSSYNYRGIRVFGTGDLQFHNYPNTRNDGVLTKALGTDASGNVILGTLPSGGGTSYTFDGGLTETSGAVKLGGTLSEATTIDMGTNTLNINGTMGGWSTANIFSFGITQFYRKANNGVIDVIVQTDYGMANQARYDHPDTGITLYDGRLDFIIDPNSPTGNATKLSYKHQDVHSQFDMNAFGSKWITLTADGWKGISLDTFGNVMINDLVGADTGMVVADASGVLGRQVIPKSVYTDDGTLTSARVISLDGNSIEFLDSVDINAVPTPISYSFSSNGVNWSLPSYWSGGYSWVLDADESLLDMWNDNAALYYREQVMSSQYFQSLSTDKHGYYFQSVASDSGDKRVEFSMEVGNSTSGYTGIYAQSNDTDNYILFGYYNALNGIVKKGIEYKLNNSILLHGLPTHADNAAATTAGLVVNQVYKTATGQLMIRY